MDTFLLVNVGLEMNFRISREKLNWKDLCPNKMA